MGSSLRPSQRPGVISRAIPDIHAQICGSVQARVVYRIPRTCACFLHADVVQRGMCAMLTHSEECNYLHRLPRPYEVADQGTDVFGREKHGQYRDDMGGVGSMLRVNKTLYVGRINEETSLSFRRASANPKDNQDDTGKTPMSRIVRRHFSEWGEIEHGKYQHD